MTLIKTPPPTLLRARFATALDHLPSVPSVVLPIMSSAETGWALPLLKPQLPEFVENTGISVIWREVWAEFDDPISF